MSSPPRPASFAPVSPTPRTRSLSRRASSSSLSSTAQRVTSTSTSAIPPTPALPSQPPTAAIVSSPHYSTSLRSRHSLYGTEDRVVLDLGSRVWKIGFSGETQPRCCVGVEKLLAKERNSFGTSQGKDEMEGEQELWGLDKGMRDEEEWMIREERLKRGLRDVWFDHLMTDPKTRKVLVIENPLLPTQVKDMIARVLFDNLQVPAINFASAPLLSLMTAGAVTGLVVDVGHLETTVLPVYHARPLFSYLTSTPLAGSRLNTRLRSLLLSHASYAPPPSSLNSMTIPQSTQVPPKVLTEELIEEIKTRCCFVGEEIREDERLLKEYDEALNDRIRRESSTLTSSSSAKDLDSASTQEDPFDPDLPLVNYLYKRYSLTAPSTTSLSFRIPHLSSPMPPTGVGKGHLLIPSWIRERSAEILFDPTLETQDSLSIQSTILECVLRLPMDLRRPMISNLLVTGGTASLPGFIPRLKASLLTQLRESHPPSPPPSPPLPSTPLDPAARLRKTRLSQRLHNLRHSPRYAPLVALSSSLSILNSPSPTLDPPAPASEGSAPAFHPSLYAWVGGSLAGALKLGGEEMTREEWDEGYELTREMEGDEEGSEGDGNSLRRERRRGKKLQDWTKIGYL